MKKIISTISIIGMFVLTSTAYAAEGDNASEAKGSITLSDSGRGPGIQNIAVSERSLVSYSGLASAGGYNGNYTGCAPQAGDVMAVTSASSAADPKIALYFAVRDSNIPECPPDNNVYQKPANGTAPKLSDVSGELTVNLGTSTAYMVRGKRAGS